MRLVHRVGCAECVSGTPAGWGESPSLQTYRVEVRGFDRPGLLHDITAVLLADRASMSAMQASSDADDKTARIAFDLGAGGLKGLVRIIDRMSQVDGVIDARRVG